MVSAPGDVGPGQRLSFSDTGGMGSVQIWPKPRGIWVIKLASKGRRRRDGGCSAEEAFN